MNKDKKAFGDFLREMIKQSEISQSEFYSAVEITKPYFYDILSGKVNPPPSNIQYKMLNHLKMTDLQRNEFLDLAAKGRGEIPADIASIIENNPQKLDEIRTVLRNMFVDKENRQEKSAKGE